MSTKQTVNRRIVLAARPQEAADASHFRLETAPIEPPRDGEILLRTMWLSLDPYMRGRMTDAPSYAPPVEIGAVMVGGTVSRVEASRNPNFSPGDWALSASGWQEYSISDGAGLVKLPPGLPSPSYALGVMGMTGFTAYIGLLDIGKPCAGETVVVSAATGAVGSIVGQIAKIKGCRVIGVAGGPGKCAYAVEELGFDACIDHRSEALDAELASACPGGVDVYYENVGGKTFSAVLPLLNPHARIPLCGLISQYNERPAAGARGSSQSSLMRAFLIKRISVRGFIIGDGFDHRRAEFLQTMSVWLRDGKVKYREDIVDGLDKAPQAFIGLLAGRNFGKLVVKVADADRGGTVAEGAR